MFIQRADTQSAMSGVEERAMSVVKRGADATSACQIEFGDANQGPSGVCKPVIEKTRLHFLQSCDNPRIVMSCCITENFS